MNLYYNRKKHLMDEIDEILPCGENESFDTWMVEVENLIDEMIDNIDDLKDEIEMINDNS